MSADGPDLAASASAPPRPFDLLTEAADRLAIVSLLFVMAFFLAWVAAPPAPAGTFPILDVSFGAATVASFAVLVAARTLRDRPHRLAVIALVFQVVASLSIALAEHWWPWPPDATVRGVSWICVVLVTLPMVIASAPTQTAVASLLSASMAPLALGLTILYGNPAPSPSTMSALFLPVYLCAGIAYALARLMARPGGDDEGQVMGGYRLVRRIGRGGMGEVWLGTHAMIGRPAAVKFVDPEVVSASIGEDPFVVFRRFEREAQATAQLDSPHTVSLFDFGYASNGAFYYVMELLDGLDLETLVRRHGPMPAARVTLVLRQVCASLAEAHAAGLVHRDVKPANIFLTNDGADGDFAKVLDFGLVISSESAKEQLTRLTNEGLTSGTPAYMAPETASGAELDARADLYGLGCVAYWMLTGRQVFESRSPMRLLADHVQTQPVPPSQRTELAIPEDLEQIVLQCLEKHPDRRPKSAEALARSLEVLTCDPPWTSTRAAKWWRVNAPTRAADEPT